MTKLDIFTESYITTALWAETDNSDESGGEPLEHNYDVTDIAPEAMESIIADCTKFQEQAADLLDAASTAGDYPVSPDSLNVDDQAGHDFWLTRNGHGAGFWDGDWPTSGIELTRLSHTFGPAYIYIGDDEDLHYLPNP